jgi:hypothetical protein
VAYHICMYPLQIWSKSEIKIGTDSNTGDDDYCYYSLFVNYRIANNRLRAEQEHIFTLLLSKK